MKPYYDEKGITLYNADCLPAMKEMPDNAFDLAIVDPPYGIGITDAGWVKSNSNIITSNKWDNNIPPREYFDELFRVSKNQIIWGGNYFLDYLTNTRCFVIWDKQIGECTSFASSELAWTSFDKSTKTFYEHPAKHGKAKIHPTQKPVLLYKWLLTKYAKPGQTILDTHLGSMSSVIACIDMGYSITGYEVDKEYFDNGVSRVQRHLSQGRLFGLDFNLDIHYN